MIFVECKTDGRLVQSITNIPKREVIHELTGKGGVCNQLKKRRDCKGLVDEDPLSSQPNYIRRLQLAKHFQEHALKLLHDVSNDNYVIVLCPRLEGWILKAAKELNIDLSQYDLPDDETKLHSVINTRLDGFEKLLEELKGSEQLKLLKRLLEQKH